MAHCGLVIHYELASEANDNHSPLMQTGTQTPESNPQKPSIHADSEALVPDELRVQTCTLPENFGYKMGTNGTILSFESDFESKKEPPGRRPFFGINPGFMRVCGPYFSASDTATAQATVAPTIGLLPMPMSPIISTCAGTEEDPANCASPCIRPMESVRP